MLLHSCSIEALISYQFNRSFVQPCGMRVCFSQAVCDDPPQSQVLVYSLSAPASVELNALSVVGLWYIADY